MGLGCVKTHTSSKCRKYNFPTRYRAESAQIGLGHFLEHAAHGCELAGPRGASSSSCLSSQCSHGIDFPRQRSSLLSTRVRHRTVGMQVETGGCASRKRSITGYGYPTVIK